MSFLSSGPFTQVRTARAHTHTHTRSTTGVLKPCLCSSVNTRREWPIPTLKPGKLTSAVPWTRSPTSKEVKDKSVNKGCGAVRVYRMLPAVHQEEDEESKSRDSRKRKVSVCQLVCSTGDHFQQLQSIKEFCMCVQIKDRGRWRSRDAFRDDSREHHRQHRQSK